MFDLPPPEPHFEIVVASRGMSKGLAQTEGVQFVPKGFLQIGAVQIGGQWKNVTSTTAAGEAAVFANASRTVGGFQLSLGAAYKFQTAVRGPTDSDSFEFSGSVGRKFGKLGTKVSVIYSPNDLGSARRSVYFEGGPTLDLSKTTRIFANVGHRDRIGGFDYTSFNAGLSTVVAKRLTLEARYYDTARSHLDKAYRGRAVLAARLSF
ncbi:TorF family putative porin [Sphingomonas sp.]|uniref:TorF family putative porin n=1 Tax=Sphingomonas sp. TaxID=28214 RepID=UPI00286E0687|nr:TorF family putative porin [Sphingomonas sp.]